jgi:hypothetical protein
MGYFNQGRSPILRLCRMNLIPIALATLTIAEMIFGKGSGLGMLLMTLFTTIYLSFCSPPSRRQPDSEPTSLLQRFALTSWRNDN